uniref:Uncharacterized protein n=1 Tax=Mandrillus leucophaeus TaxID=9568 RepID=A0A2K6AHW2_MANLE
MSLQIPGRKLPQIPPLGGGSRPQVRREQGRKQHRCGAFAARRHPRTNSLTPARDIQERPRLLITPYISATQPRLCRGEDLRVGVDWTLSHPSNCDLGAVTSECHPPLARPSEQPHP